MNTQYETDVEQTKQLRKDIDNQLQILKTGFSRDQNDADTTEREFPQRTSRERSLAITKLQEAIMWLGMDLKDLGEANPYPSSYKPEETSIERTADGLKL